MKNVSPNMNIASEEVFGPIAPIITVDDENEAMKYGLGASIWTQDLDKAEKLSRAVESGIVTVNNVAISDPRVPFGGIKSSGFGRGYQDVGC
jgi:acyl-CoA reductase-like NAD-dependent aldehyde dehydrogenase